MRHPRAASSVRISRLALLAPALLLSTSAADAGRLALVLNPYDGIDWATATPRKANVHTHTTQSDGRFSPDQTVDEYRKRGYAALAITDHDRCTFPWTKWQRDPQALGMAAIPGNELSRHHHTLSLFSDFTTSSRDQEEALDQLEAHSDRALAVLAHPAMHWPHQFGPEVGLRTPMADAIRHITQGDFTVEARFRTRDAGRGILAGSFSPNAPGSLNLEVHTGNRVRVYVQPRSGRTVDLNVPAEKLGIDTRDGQWHHLAGVRRGKEVSLYLDAKLAGVLPDTAGAYDLQGESCYVGRDQRTAGTILNGDLDLVRLWTRGLDAAAVARLATDGTVGDEKAGLLLQYDFATSRGVPMRADARIEPLIDDTAGHPAGPFHALAAKDTPVWRIVDGDRQVASFRPQPNDQKHVPKQALDHYLKLYRKHERLVGMEIVNGTRPLREYPLDRELWDLLLNELMPNRPVWGLATDDMHSASHLGHDWLVLPLATLDEEAIRQAMIRGAYYFSTERVSAGTKRGEQPPPQIASIVHDPQAGTILVHATAGGEAMPEPAYQWIAEGKLLQTGPRLDYRSAKGIRNYVRLEITGPGGTTYTNPFGFRTGGE